MGVSELHDRIKQLADLIEEHDLEAATLKGDDWKVSFDRRQPTVAVVNGSAPAAPAQAPRAAAPAKQAAPEGTAITSPMTGIYYASPSPGSENFVSEGQTISSGDPIGLIEAMKVFNEVPASTSGVVSKICVENGQLVQPGDPLIYVK
jgi:acetyl-CoA carboxylase biotin carboxyl carrier protein